MRKQFWVRLGVAVLIVLLLWWLYVAILLNEEETDELSWIPPYSSSIR